MNPKRVLCLLPVLLSLLAVQSGTLGTAFTYQGSLADARGAATGQYDFRCTLYDALTNGTLVAEPLTSASVGVTNGLFSLSLDFGNVFDGNARWLQLAVRSNGASLFTVMSPRQPLTAAPYATYAPTAGAATLASGVSPGAITTVMLADGSVSSSKLGAAVVKPVHIDDGGSAAYEDFVRTARTFTRTDPLPFAALSLVSSNSGAAPAMTFALDGAAVGTVAGFTGCEAMSAPYEFVVEVIVPSAALDPEAQLGRGGLLRFTRNGRTTRFGGRVTGCSVSSHDGTNACYSFRLESPLAYLALTSDYRTYAEMTVPEILSELYSTLASGTVNQALSGLHATREATLQWGETGLSFFNRLAEDEGIFYFFEVSAASPGLVLGDAVDAYLPAPNSPFSYYGEVATNAPPAAEYLQSFRKATREFVGSSTLDSFDFKRPSTDLQVTAQTSPGRGASYEFGSTHTALPVLQALVNGRQQRQVVERLTTAGAGNAPDLRPGYTFTLDDRSGAGVEGAYLVTAVRHSAFRRLTNGVATLYYGNQFEVIPAATPYRPARKTPKPVAQPCTALVTGPAGEEIWTDAHGRVKVQFHWDRYGTSDQNSSAWIRVASPWAGRGWGVIAIPRIGQEVIVDFIQGDPDQPVITGSLYNGANPPPYALPANKTMTGIRTHSTTNGDGFNEIRFEDKRGAEQLHINAEKNLDVLVGYNMTSAVEHDLSSTVANNLHQSVGNDLTISAGRDLRLSTPRGVGINTANDPALALKVGGIVGATVFQGSGSGLTSLPAAALTGTVSDANLPLTLARLNAAQTFTGNNSFLGRISAGGPLGLDTLNLHGTARLNNHDLYLREGSDTNHGLGWRGDFKPFAGVNPDGPVLFGCAGGALGTVCNNERMALRWDWSGRVGFDPHNLNAGNLLSGALTFGANQTEGMASASTGGGNVNGLDFYTAGTHRLAITSGGQVGIGISNPSHLLQLHSATSTNLLRLTGPGVNYSGAKLNFGDAEYVYLHEVADDMLRLQANRTGLGRTPTANRLEVEGEASKSAAGGWLANSDLRIKQDIQPVREARAVLDKVRPVSFRYTEQYLKAHPDLADRRYLNVVAQEFREVFPDHVKSSGERLADGTDILQVDTYPLTLYSVAAIRELDQELAAKDARIRELEQRLTALESLVLNQGK